MASNALLRATHKTSIEEQIDSMVNPSLSGPSFVDTGLELWHAWLLSVQLQSETSVFGQARIICDRRARVEAAMDNLCMCLYI
jgi:hypothetical protein